MVTSHRFVAAFLTLLLTACSLPATAGESGKIAAVLGLQPGSVVADVGAGDGKWSEKLARKVGASGHVYATEIDPDDVDKLRRRFEKDKFQNVTAVLGDDTGTGLPEGCCDAILLRMVYHHFTEPEKMRASLRRSLKPGGEVVVIDIVPQTGWRELPGVPDRGGHGLPVDVLVAEMTADGFKVVEQRAEWNGDDERYLVVFRAGEPIS